VTTLGSGQRTAHLDDVTDQSRFGEYGGQFVAETLVAPLDELWRTCLEARTDPLFQAELDDLLSTFVGRPTPLTRLHRLGIEPHGVTIWLKREDLTRGSCRR